MKALGDTYAIRRDPSAPGLLAFNEDGPGFTLWHQEGRAARVERLHGSPSGRRPWDDGAMCVRERRGRLAEASR